MSRLLSRWLEHPLTRNIPLDDPETTRLRKRIIQEKRFLRKIYEEWYASIITEIPGGDGAVVELGSGAGFFRELFPSVITTDVVPAGGVQLQTSGMALPFCNTALRAIVMTNTLHHLPDVESFFHEAARCLKARGAVIMIEPWVTRWSTWVYSKLHHEPFLPDSPEWKIPAAGPLSTANEALPWILFARDRSRFEKRFPELSIHSIRPFMPFRYLLSGGVGLRSFMPGWSFLFWKGIENSLERRMDRLAMFARIVVIRKGSCEPSHPAEARDIA